MLVEHCYQCHSTQSKKLKGGLRLDSREALWKGGESGPAVIPNRPDESLLIRAVRYGDLDPQMPPNGKLKPQQVVDFESWVLMGGPYPSAESPAVAATDGIDFDKARAFWSFRPVVETRLPRVKDTLWPKSPIDCFLLARQEEKGLTPAPPADRRTLVRRATFDLTGLAPTPEEVEDFVQDHSPGAFEKVVDRLLASPHYGERWGRHWLDVVRYADTAGCNSDYPVPDAYKYRNYVIQSFNEDKPYDQFIREQIAGDLLPGLTDQERFQQIIATGYLAISRHYGSSDPEFHLTIEDTIDNLGKAFLGLSISCARCHDHKFDPIPTRDYYSLYGIFQSTRYAFPGMEDFKHPRDFVALSDDADRATFFAYQAAVFDLDQELFRLTQEQKALQRTAGSIGPLEQPESAPRTLDQVKLELQAAKEKQVRLLRTAPEVTKAYAVWEGHAANARIHIKGDPNRPGEAVSRGFLQVLGGQKLTEQAQGSGRSELADWLTDPKNPLTARVVVNRIWQHHFGKGIVQTPNDFGTRGRSPTHPELLDWLATRFREGGQSIKAMHKLIMLSSTYQLSSSDEPGNALIDPSNDCLWRFNGRRLDAEELRDTLLAIGGNLDRSPGRRHPFPPESEFRFTQHKPFSAVYETRQRSVYLMRQRKQAHPYLDLFDANDPKATTPVRPVSTTAIQALFMMNSAFVHEQAGQLADRLIQAKEEDGARIEQAYKLALARPPTGHEVREVKEYLKECQALIRQDGAPGEQLTHMTWASFCRVLLSSNEFILID